MTYTKRGVRYELNHAFSCMYISIIICIILIALFPLRAIGATQSDARSPVRTSLTHLPRWVTVRPVLYIHNTCTPIIFAKNSLAKVVQQSFSPYFVPAIFQIFKTQIPYSNPANYDEKKRTVQILLK